MSGQDYEQLTLFQGGSHASRLVVPGSEEARMMTVTSGQKCLELSKKSGPLGSLEKTLLTSSTWRSTKCYLTWKPKITKQGHLLFRLVPSTPRTGGTDAPLLPTPTATLANHGGPNQRDSSGRPGLQMAAMMWPPPTTGAVLCGGTGNYQQLKALEAHGQISEEKRRSMATGNGGLLNPTWVEAMMGFPIGWSELED